MGFAVRLAVRPTLTAQKGHALYPIRRASAMRGTLFRTVGRRRMHLTTGAAAARSLLAIAGPSVNMPSLAMPPLAGPSVALLAGTMVASVGMPFIGTPPVTVACALRTLAWPARPALSLLLRGSAGIAAAGIGAVVLARQRHADQPLDVAQV